MKLEDLPDWALLPSERRTIYKRKPKAGSHDNTYGSRPEEVDALAMIMKWHYEGADCFTIAGRLNERHFICRGKRWYETSVLRIIKRGGRTTCECSVCKMIAESRARKAHQPLESPRP